MPKIWIIVFVGALLILTLALDRFFSQKNEDKKSAEEAREGGRPKDPPDDEKNRFDIDGT